jgi:hypothetical protein
MESCIGMSAAGAALQANKNPAVDESGGISPGVRRNFALFRRTLAYPALVMAACAAASRAIGTRNGEQLT